MKKFLILTPFILTSLAFAQSPDPMIDKIINEGKNRNQVMKHLLGLTHGIGPRLTGSPNALKACNWAANLFRSFGCENVHLEEWGEMPVGFARGKRQSAKIILPRSEDIVFTTMSWTPGTDGPMRGHAIVEPQTEAEFEKVKDKIKGAWLLSQVPFAQRGISREDTGDLKARIDALKPLGRIHSSGAEIVRTNGRFTGLEWDKLPTERRIIIQKSRHETLSAYARLGTPVELEFDIENIFIKGPSKMYNVIAEIPGTDLKHEVVIVCGHIDSWDGPGSLGANDNGTGTSVAIEAARILKKVGAKPRRTIRFILWTGEEQGLLGARAYALKHKDELKNVSAVLNDDGGTNYQGGYSCLKEHEPILAAAIAPVQKAFPELAMKLDVRDSFPRGGSSDHAAFIPYGVPGFFTMESGRADYGFVWHTQNDRPEHSIPEYLIQSSTNHAAVSYYLANHEKLLARIPAPSTPTAMDQLTPPVGNARNYIFAEPHEELDPKNHDHDDEFWGFWFDTFRHGMPRWLRTIRIR